MKPGPYLFKWSGRYAFGRRALIELDDLAVLDLGEPPDEHPAGEGIAEVYFLDKEVVDLQDDSDIDEEEEPLDGLDINEWANPVMYNPTSDAWTTP